MCSTDSSVFLCVSGSNVQDYVAIDDVLLIDGSCPVPGECDFERGFCGFSNVPSAEDKFDWLWTNAATPTTHDKPVTDQTTGKQQLHFLSIM